MLMKLTWMLRSKFKAASRNQKIMPQKIKAEVKNQVGISFTIGVGPNKLVAKIACDSQKPDGLTIIKPDEVKCFLVAVAR